MMPSCPHFLAYIVQAVHLRQHTSIVAASAHAGRPDALKTRLHSRHNGDRVQEAPRPLSLIHI
eukprot:5917765-Lingulodinium_polyedra.AAC.1